MLKTFLTIFIVAIALLSLIVLITIEYLNNLILFGISSINIISLYLMIFNIQSIGWNITTFSSFFIFLNNIFLSLIRLFIINYSTKNKFKDFLITILTNYIKFFFIYPNYLLREGFSIASKILNIFNNRINNLLYQFSDAEPLKLIDKNYDDKNKYTLFTFENNQLLDHKNLFVALFLSLSLQEEFLKSGKKNYDCFY